MKRSLHLSLERRQVMAFALQQSLKILQLSSLELTEWIQNELQQNPLLEESPRKQSFSPPPEILEPVAKLTLRQHLLSQAREACNVPEDLQIAECLIDHLDEKGFLTGAEEIPWPEPDVSRVLAIIQTFDPPGIGAKNLQESLLLQLGRGSYCLAEILIRDHFEDLLHKRFGAIQKQLRISLAELKGAVSQVAKLRMRPSEAWREGPPIAWMPDLTIQESEEGWKILAGEEELGFAIRNEYATLKESCSREERETVKGWLTSAKWLRRCVLRRRHVLLQIGKLLLEARSSYFENGKAVEPIGIQELAKRLSVHPSTAWRAVSHKMLLGPHGMIPLSNFFSQAATADPVKELLRRLVQQENKLTPYTDSDLAGLLQEQGVRCARRTISKYRKALKIGSAAQRKVNG